MRYRSGRTQVEPTRKDRVSCRARRQAQHAPKPFPAGRFNASQATEGTCAEDRFTGLDRAAGMRESESDASGQNLMRAGLTRLMNPVASRKAHDEHKGATRCRTLTALSGSPFDASAASSAIRHMVRRSLCTSCTLLVFKAADLPRDRQGYFGGPGDASSGLTVFSRVSPSCCIRARSVVGEMPSSSAARVW